MKELTLTFYLLFIIFVSQLFGQTCWDCPTENKAIGLSSISIGTSTSVTGLNSFAGGTSSQVLSSNSFAYGNYAIVLSTASNSFAFGNNLKAGLPNSIIIGSGIDKFNYLENNITNSIMLGVTAVPSLTIVRQSNTSLPGYIGIGTITPEELLSVSGNLLLESSLTTSGELKFKYGNSIGDDMWIVFSDNTGVRFDKRIVGLDSKPKNILFLDKDEKVGIGTTSPSERLHVTGNILSEDKIIGKNEIMLVPDYTTTNVGWHIKREAPGLYFIYDAGGDIDVTKYNLYIENDGNIGIGTISPTKKLDVNGDIKASQLTLNGLSTNSGRIIKIGTGGLLTYSSISESSNGDIKIVGTNNESKNLEVTGDINGNNITLSSLSTNSGKIVKVGTNGLLASSNIYETSIGRVGISTTDPQEQFQIGDEWTFHNGGTKYIGRNIRYNGTNNVRIIQGASSLLSFSSEGNIGLYVYEEGATNTVVNQTGNITLLNNGNVGIGTTNPTKKLEVMGDIKGANIFLTNNIDVSTLFASMVGIEVTNIPTGYKLAVGGKIICEELVVKLKQNWPDYVFEKDYSLKSLKEVETFINENKHLPDIPSAKEIEEGGIGLAEMSSLLLKKIEELTLYIIEQNKQISEQNNRIYILENILER